MYKVKEFKGDISFCEDEKGKLYQRILMREIFPVVDGKMAYKHIQTVDGLDIRYNTNGVSGFCIFNGEKMLSDNIWEISKAVEVANTLK